MADIGQVLATGGTALVSADRRAVQGGLRLPAAPVLLDPGQAVQPRADLLRVCGQDFQPLDEGSGGDGPAEM